LAVQALPSAGPSEPAPLDAVPQSLKTAAPRRLRKLVLTLVPLGILAAAGWFGFWRYHLKRFEIVERGALYRTAQPTEFGLWYLVRRHGVRTVLNVRLEDARLCQGLLDWGEEDGRRESQYVASLGARHMQWPMGEEEYWPWLTPWQYEEFFKLFDEPANLPVAVHCMGGRHRTGTFVALYRLEYQRAAVEPVLKEMLSFDFGQPAWIQTHNLRTYLPRPRPAPEQWDELMSGLYAQSEPRPADYDTLVRRWRGVKDPTSVAKLEVYVRERRPFAICLAQRVVDSETHPLATAATGAASVCLQDASANHHDWAAAASLVADFGTPDQQRGLYRLLEQESRLGPPTPRYQAVVAGVTNRYTPNRIAWLKPLLDDTRARPEAAARQYRYCDTAAARLASMTDQLLVVEREPAREAWNDGVQKARRWFAEHPEQLQLARWRPPPGNNALRPQRLTAGRDGDMRGEMK
jgi:hypothetical protein